MQASGVPLPPVEPPPLTGAALAQDIDSKCFVRNGRSIIDQRLRRRALLGGVMASVGYFSYYAAVQVESVRGRDTAMYAVPVLCYVVMACITPAATPEDINPAMEWCMRYASALSATQALSLWVKSAQTHPCGSLVAIPGLLGVIARWCVPLLGLRNPMWFWPAERCVLIFMGCLRFLQVAVQRHALLLADVAARLVSWPTTMRAPRPHASFGVRVDEVAGRVEFFRQIHEVAVPMPLPEGKSAGAVFPAQCLWRTSMRYALQLDLMQLGSRES